MSAIDVASRSVAATAGGVGARCWGIAVTPDGRKLYVANGPSDDVAILDVSTLMMLKRVRTGSLLWDVDMGVTEADAKDIAAYLETLRWRGPPARVTA